MRHPQTLSRLKKYTLPILFLSAAFIFSSLARASSSGDRLLFGEEYFHALRQAFQEAGDSIWIEMYYMDAKADDPGNPVNILINDLRDAKARGVEVKVVLEDRLLDNNYNAYNALNQAGISVHLDSQASLLHSKAVVIDKKILFIGSANWSKSAFYANNEVSVLIESPKLAAQLAEQFKKIQLSNVPVSFQYSGVKIPRQLLTGPSKLPLLLSNGSEKAFDLYLLLFKACQSAHSPTIALNYAQLAQEMHYRAPAQGNVLKQTYTKFFYFFNIYQPLKKLTRNYKLLARQPWSKEVTVLDFNPDDSANFILPFEYWDYGLDKELSLGAKFTWLMALQEATESKRSPYWFRSQNGLAQKYHIGERAINKGILELEREELLEVFRHVPQDPRHPENRPANDYRLNPIPSPADLKKEEALLIQEYGLPLFNQAKGLSSALGQPKDIGKIEIFIGLINKYGYPAVSRAVARARQKRLESGLRSLSYVISSLEPLNAP
jgi:HKD family nuclease